VTVPSQHDPQTPADSRGDLSITALYTAQTWRWAKLPHAELFETPAGRAVFWITNMGLVIAKLFMWSLRSLKHSLLHRHTMIDHLVRQQKPDMVLELAAGLSRRGSTFSADSSLRYVEVDRPHVVEHKRRLLNRSARGQAVLARENWSLVGRDIQELALGELTIDAFRPLVIAEGLFMYLNADEQRTLWGRVAAALAGRENSLFVFDLVPTCEQPKPGPVGRLLEWIMKRFTGGRSFERDERTREDIRTELHEAGFASVRLIEPHDIAVPWDLPFPNKQTQQLLFVCRGNGVSISPQTVEQSPESTR
jgi:O-methyltransferase involved in polyketide biosynthesis